MLSRLPPAARRSDRRTRRAVLLSIGTGTAALAGCLSETDDTADDGSADDPAGSEDSLPDYANWLPDDDSLFFAYARLDAGDDEAAEVDFTPDDSVDDPLVTFPAEVGGSAVGLYVLSLLSTGLNPVIDPETETQSDAEALLGVNEAVVLTGTFDIEALDDRLTDDSEPFAATYERSGDIQGFDLYEPSEIPEEVDDPLAVGINEANVLVAPDDERLERVAATGRGDRPQITGQDDDVAWLLEQAGDSDVALGQVGSDPDAELSLEAATEFIDGELQFEPAADENVVTALDVDSDAETVDARFALTADELSEATETTAEEAFGTAAVDASVEVDDNRITAAGTYDAVEIGATIDEDASGERGELTQEEARELVPLDALDYWYQPATGQRLPQFWVEVTEDTDAMGIRVEAESWAENEITVPDGTVSARTSVPVQVEPDKDDKVTVFAVDDDEAIGQLDTVDVPTDELSEDAAAEAVPETALSFEYDPPGSQFGSLTVDVTEETTADVLIAQPTEAPGSFADHAGSLDGESTVGAETTLEAAVDPDGDTIVIFATVDGATGEVARWEGPD